MSEGDMSGPITESMTGPTVACFLSMGMIEQVIDGIPLHVTEGHVFSYSLWVPQSPLVYHISASRYLIQFCLFQNGF